MFSTKTYKTYLAPVTSTIFRLDPWILGRTTMGESMKWTHIAMTTYWHTFALLKGVSLFKVPYRSLQEITLS